MEDFPNRIKAICYAIYLLGIYYIVMLVRGVYNGNLEEADNSIAIVYMVFNVICLEFGVQKSRVDRLFVSIRPRACFFPSFPSYLCGFIIILIHYVFSIRIF